MPNFIGGLPAQSSPLVSSEVRNNFDALNARSDKLTPRATVPASTRINVGPGIVYFADNVQVNFLGQQVNLGDDLTGVAPFNNIGYFKDIIIVVRATFDDSNNRYSATALFLEGPEKASSTPQPELVQLSSGDLPVAALTVRHNGLNVGTLKGQIEPVQQDSIIDDRAYVNVGALTYYSTTVGDRQVLRDGYGAVILDGYGVPLVSGETVGVYTGLDGYAASHPIQQAIDYVSGRGGGTVFLRRGIYVPFETITIPSNVTLLGEGANTVLFRQDTFTGPMVSMTGEHAAMTDIFVKGPTTHTFAYGPLVQFTTAQYCAMRGCIIDASGVDAVAFTNISAKNIFHSNFIISAETALYTSIDSTKNLITGNQLDNYVTFFDDNGVQNKYEANVDNE